MKSSEIVFVIIGFHPDKNILLSLLAALKNVNVIVVNNGGVVLENSRSVQVISSGENLGYAGGANIGLKAAFEKGASWVVICNQDVVMTTTGVKELVSKLKSSPAGIAGPFAGGLDPNRMMTIIPSNNVDYISGSCIAIGKKAYEKIGNFYEPYFLYYEEVDYCMRAKKVGFPIVHLKIHGIRHTESSTLGNNSLMHQYYLSRNHLLFVRRGAYWKTMVYECIRLPLTLLEHIRRNQWGALLGMYDFLFCRFGQKERI